MNVFELEEKRKLLNRKLTEEKSPRFCLLLITDYFEEVLVSEDQTILNAYLPEFIPNYIKYLNAYSPQGLHPQKTEKIILTAKKILSIGLSEEEKKKIKDAVAGIKAGLSFLKAILEGAEVEEEISFNTSEGKRLNESDKAFVSFPVLERVTDRDVSLGLLENLSVMIQKKNLREPDSFELIPSSRELDEKLKGQIHASWSVAKKYVAGKVKITHSHTAIIKFNNKYGEYIGDSLGAALTLSFIGELLKTYNAREQIQVNANAAFTGSLRENGDVGEITDGIISKKSETVFFSAAEVFVVPKEDEAAAVKKTNELKKEFPKRNLKIVGVESLYEILLRRDLVDIKKQNIVLYSAKKAYTPKFAFTFMLAVVLMVSAILYEKFDDNPTFLEYKNGYLNVLNRMGDTLWTTKNGPERLEKDSYKSQRKYYSRKIDIDNDGKNEVLLIGETLDKEKFPNWHLNIICYSNTKKLLWSYRFIEKIRDCQDVFDDSRFVPRIIDVLNKPNRKEIIIAAQQTMYANAIFRLDFNGKKIGETLWHPGGAGNGFVADIDEDGKEELVIAGINNGIESSVLFSIELDKFGGRAPTKGKYRFPDYDLATFDNYVILPRTDYNYFCVGGTTYNVPININFNVKDKYILFMLDANPNNLEYEAYNVYFNFDFSFREFQFGNPFEALRNECVKSGKLKGPLTDTPEFKEILRNQIEYWNGREFISINEWDGKQAAPPSPDSKY